MARQGQQRRARLGRQLPVPKDGQGRLEHHVTQFRAGPALPANAPEVELPGDEGRQRVIGRQARPPLRQEVVEDLSQVRVRVGAADPRRSCLSRERLELIEHAEKLTVLRTEGSVDHRPSRQQLQTQHGPGKLGAVGRSFVGSAPLVVESDQTTPTRERETVNRWERDTAAWRRLFGFFGGFFSGFFGGFFGGQGQLPVVNSPGLH